METKENREKIWDGFENLLSRIKEAENIKRVSYRKLLIKNCRSKELKKIETQIIELVALASLVENLLEKREELLWNGDESFLKELNKLKEEIESYLEGFEYV